MDTIKTAEILVREHLMVLSNLNYEYGIHTEFEDLKNDPNFKKAVQCANVSLHFSRGNLYGMSNSQEINPIDVQNGLVELIKEYAIE